MPVIEYILKGDSKGLVSATDGATKSMGGAVNAAGALASGMLALGSAYASVIQSTVETVDQVNTLAKASGLSAGSINGLRLAAKASGKELTDLVPTKLAKNMRAAQQGSKAMEQAFNDLGVSATNSDGSLRDVNEVLPELIESLKKNKTDTEAAAIASELLGKQGREMLSAFDDAAGFERFVELGGKFGTEVGPDAIAAASAWQASTARVGLAFEEASASFVSAFGGTSAAAGALDSFALGLIFVTELIEHRLVQTMGQLKEASDVAFALLKNDVIGAAKEMRDLDWDVMNTSDSLMAAGKRAHEFWAEQKEGAEDAADAVGGETDAQDGKTAALTKQRDVLGELAAAQGLLASIAESAAADQLSAADKIDQAAQRRLDAIEAEEAALRELEAANVDVQAGMLAASEARAQVEDRRVRDLTQLKIDEAQRAADEVAAIEQEAHDAWQVRMDEAQAISMAHYEGQVEAVELRHDRERAAIDNTLATIEGAADIAVEMHQREIEQQLKKEERIMAIMEAARAEGRTVSKQQRKKLKGIRKELKEERKAKLRAFRLGKAAALAGIAIDSARSMLAMLPGFSYLTFGAPAAAAGVVLPFAAIQAANVAAEKPPKFHDGRAGSDELLATLRRQESVLNQRATETVGRQAIDAANRGVGLGGGGVTQIVFKQRTLDTMMAETINSGGSTQRLISEGRPPAGTLDPFGGI